MGLESILELFEKHKGQFVITEGWEVQRLVAVAEDQDDLYWVYYDGREVHLSTCVGGFTVLKGFIEEKQYQRFIHLAKLNHYDSVKLWGNKDEVEMKKFNDQEKEKIEHYLDQYENNKYITPICWDLN